VISAHRRGWGQVAVRCNRLCYCIRGLPLSQAASPFYGTLPRFGGAFSCVFPPALCATNGAARRWGGGLAVLRRDRQVLLMTNDGPTLAPLLWRGFCLGAPLHKMLRPAAGPALCNQPPAASLSGRVDPTSAGWSTRAKCGRKLSPASLSLWCAGLFLWPVAGATNEEPHL
jgi:hypothetical protein